MRRLIAVVGPTATGKSALALSLAVRYRGEIVNADSRQIYRYMDIGTAKPTMEQRSAVPHHLIDVTMPDETAGLARYQELAQAALDDIWQRGRLPILVGGAGQYVWAVLEGWNIPRVRPDFDLRRDLEERAQRMGAERLWAELERIDPAAANKIHKHNVRRLVRALEVCLRLGRPISECQTKNPLQCDQLIIGLSCSQEVLRARIELRVGEMLSRGLVSEVRSLLSQGYHRQLPAMSSIGYREICEHLAGESSLAEAVEEVKRATQRLAKRQMAWFKAGDERIRWIDIERNPQSPEFITERFLGDMAPAGRSGV